MSHGIRQDALAGAIPTSQVRNAFMPGKILLERSIDEALGEFIWIPETTAASRVGMLEAKHKVFREVQALPSPHPRQEP